MSNTFTRQEVLKLSRLTSGKLSYLDTVGLVSPEKIGNKNRPTCLYSWEQLIELRTIYRLRQDASLQQLRQAKEYLKKIGDTDSLANKTLVAANNSIYLVKNQLGEVEKLVLELSGKKKGQVVIHSILEICDVIDEIWETVYEESKHSNVISLDSFRDRAKHKHSKEQKVA